MSKYSMIGKLNKDIYEVTDRYPLDSGEVYTKEQIDGMFELKYPKGYRLYRIDEGGGHYAWYTKDGDDGWPEFYPIEEYLSGKREHNVLSNLEIVKDNRK